MGQPAASCLVSATGLSKVYETGDVSTTALDRIDMTIQAGEFTTVVGPSGSGKTTLLNMVGALDAPTAGDLTVLGQGVNDLNRKQRADLRLHHIGFVFQDYNLMDVLTARENVEFVLELQGVERAKRRQRALTVLEDLGLADLADRKPTQLSGGQQQRVAVARAVAAHPKLVLADEPTANLDGDNAEALIAMMHRLRDEQGMTFLFSTHDPRVIRHAARVITLTDGRLTGDERNVRNTDKNAPDQETVDEPSSH